MQVEAACHALRRRAEQAEQKLATATAATAGPDASCVAHGDTIVALRRSIDMMHDDFAAEQRDHQGALATIALLQDEMELYKTQVRGGAAERRFRTVLRGTIVIYAVFVGRWPTRITSFRIGPRRNQPKSSCSGPLSLESCNTAPCYYV